MVDMPKFTDAHKKCIGCRQAIITPIWCNGCLDGPFCSACLNEHHCEDADWLYEYEDDD